MSILKDNVFVQELANKIRFLCNTMNWPKIRILILRVFLFSMRACKERNSIGRGYLANTSCCRIEKYFNTCL